MHVILLKFSATKIIDNLLIIIIVFYITCRIEWFPWRRISLPLACT